MRPAARVLTVLLLVLSLGLHWALLQTAAWAGMLVAYAQDGNLQAAITKTFDGEHPCPLCKAIEKGRSEEQRQDRKAPRSGLKLEPALAWESTAFSFVLDRPPLLPAPSRPLPSRTDEPPKPRPRLG